MDVLITVLMKTSIYMGSLIMTEREEKRPLEFSLSSLIFSPPFFILYKKENSLSYHWTYNYLNQMHALHKKDPYQVSLQEANNQIYDNFLDNDGAIPLTYFDISDFYKDPSGKIDDLIGDGNVCYD